MSRVVSRVERETAVFMPAPEGVLFGMVTPPASGPLGTAVVFLPGGGVMPWVIRSFPVALSRRAAALGYHGMRFEYGGVGESTWPSGRNFHLTHPAVDEVRAVVAWLEEEGIRRYVLVAFCFGAVTALAAAKDLPGLAGAALISAPSHHDSPSRIAADLNAWDYLRRALRLRVIKRLFQRDAWRLYRRLLAAKLQRRRAPDRAESWGRKAILEPLRALAAREIPVVLLYGDEDGDFKHLQTADPELTAGGVMGVEVQLLPGRIHPFDSLDGQEALLDAVVDRLATWQAGGRGR